MDRKNYLFTIILWLLSWNLNAQESRKMLLINPGIGVKEMGIIHQTIDFSYTKNRFWYHAQLGVELKDIINIFEQGNLLYRVSQKRHLTWYLGVAEIINFNPAFPYVSMKVYGISRILFKDRYYLELGIGGIYRRFDKTYQNYERIIYHSNKIQFGYIASFGYLLPLWKSKDNSTE
jgi:hypothetical protein